MDYLQYVNIKQGTKTSMRFSHGNTLPLVQLPFGFASFAPQTYGERGSLFYHADDRSFEGFRLTHQPSPWIGDHGAMNFMPQTGVPQLREYMRWSGFDPDETVLAPYYMKYFLKRSGCTFELTPTMYGACMRVDYAGDTDRYFSVLPVSGECEYTFVPEENRLYCYTDCNSGGAYDSGRLASYIVLQFEDGAVDEGNTLVESLSERTREKGLTVVGENTGIHLALHLRRTQIRMAVSYISYKQAVRNLTADSTYSDFDELTQVNHDLWNERLGRITVKTSEAVKKTFYSCMYRVFLYPHRAYETGKEGELIHFAPCDGTVKRGVRYTDNGFWDTYRTNYPLYSIIARDELPEMIEGFVQDYVDGGWLPRWTSGGAYRCMPSTAIDIVIADAAVKGLISKELMKTAFAGMEKHANTQSDNPAYGRDGCEEYLRLGYVPFDGHKESVNLTLDAAYCDDCLATVAEILGLEEKKDYYRGRAQSYRSLFDTKTGFMRARDTSGHFREDFDPFSWGRDYTEASAWQTSFAVQHDIDGLAELYGGRDVLIRKLDEFFETPPIFDIGGYGREIHEMTEMAAQDWGQCAISNQPSFHIPFMYAYFGQPEKTHMWLEKICAEGFSGEDDGFPGDEDNGSMSAWYIFACIGLYPICPGKPVFTVSGPLADEVKILGCKVDLSDVGSTVTYDDIMKRITKE